MAKGNNQKKSNDFFSQMRQKYGQNFMEFVQPIRDLKKIETIKKLLRQQNLRDYCLFVVGINSGLRISDLLKLRVSDVYENGKPKDRILIREKKTNKFKNFPLSDNAKSALKEYLKTRDYKDHEPLFISRKNKGFLLRQQAYKILNNVAKDVGIKEKIGLLIKIKLKSKLCKSTKISLMQSLLAFRRTNRGLSGKQIQLSNLI